MAAHLHHPSIIRSSWTEYTAEELEQGALYWIDVAQNHATTETQYLGCIEMARSALAAIIERSLARLSSSADSEALDPGFVRAERERQ
jgi:hypothetical protein